MQEAGGNGSRAELPSIHICLSYMYVLVILDPFFEHPVAMVILAVKLKVGGTDLLAC